MMIQQTYSTSDPNYAHDQIKQMSKEEFQTAEAKAKELGTTQLVIALTLDSPKLISPKLIASLLKQGADPKLPGKVKVVEIIQAGKADVELCCAVFYPLLQFSQFKIIEKILTPLEIVKKQITVLKTGDNENASIFIERLNTITELLNNKISPETVLKI